MNIVLLLAHAIEEHDQLKLLSGLGYDVFSIGGYIDPAHPHDPKRPPLPDVPFHPDLKAAVDALGTDDNLRYAKEHIPDAVLDWADTIIVHHYEHQWIVPDWPRLKAKRVIWRTVGQSVEYNERMMAPLHEDGLQIVRYSPKERNIPGFAGEDALIRFYKDPAEWYGWTGDWLMEETPRGKVVGELNDGHQGVPFVTNITQQLRQRDPFTNWGFWDEATKGLPRVEAGPGSEEVRGLGELSYEMMQKLLRGARCYLYTGTQPASYTLGLIEAMMTGIPVVSIGPEYMGIFPYGPELFEGHEIVDAGYTRTAFDDPVAAYTLLREMLEHPSVARGISMEQRSKAEYLFGMDTIGKLWRAFLG